MQAGMKVGMGWLLATAKIGQETRETSSRFSSEICLCSSAYWSRVADQVWSKQIKPTYTLLAQLLPYDGPSAPEYSEGGSRGFSDFVKFQEVVGGWYLLFVRVPSHISGRRILSHLPGFLLILGDVNPFRMADFCLD